MGNPVPLHLYRMVFVDEATGLEREVRFEDICPDPTFALARKICGEGEVTIYADDALLGRIKRSKDGFWIVSQ